MKIHWFFKVLIVIAMAIFIASGFYFGLPRVLPPQNIKNTEVYGLILSDQIWSGEIHVVGDIYSPTNSTITVLPGTKVRVAIQADKSNMDFLPWHRKSGINTGPSSKGVYNGEPYWDEAQKIQIHLNDLQIYGNFAQPVTFSSDSDNPSAYDFNVLSIRRGRINRTVFSNYRRFEAGADTIISDSSFSNTGECSICFYQGKSQVVNSVFERSLRESIWVQRASPEIINNLFQNLLGEGIRVDAKRLSVPVITDNTFEMPEKTAINLISGGQMEEGLIARNFFSGNSEIKIACDSKFKIRDNIILGLVSFSSGCGGGFTFGPNFWGSPDVRTILAEKILNKNSTFKIEIPTVLLIPPKDAGRK